MIIKYYRAALRVRNKKCLLGGLTLNRDMVRFPQQTRQASVLRDTLNFGGFLFSGRSQ
jgi:hypothetical protein